MTKKDHKSLGDGYWKREYSSESARRQSFEVHSESVSDLLRSTGVSGVSSPKESDQKK